MKPFTLRWTLRLSLAFLAGHLFAAPQQSPNAAIQGVVKALRTGKPIGGARVFLLDALQNERAFTKVPTTSVFTRNTGEFFFENVDPGTYQIVITNDGYVKRESPKLVLVPGQRMRDMVFQMAPTGNISGRVSNPSGKPLAGVTVTLLRPSYNADGSPTLRASGAAQSNDLGEYRLFWITPGKYYVMAGGDIERIYYDVQGGFDTSVRLGLNSVSDRYPPVFLPGVGDLSRATLVDLQEETELRGMNFTLSRQQFYSIRGHLIDATTGKPPADAGLSLTQRDFTGYGVMEPVDFDSSTGAFDVALPPGRYLLSASGPGTGSYPSYSTPGVPWTDREVVIRDGNADVELSLAVQPIITGQIALRGTLPAGKSLDQVRISLLPMDSLLPLRFQNPSATSDNTGKFRLAAEREGSYRVRVSGLPQGFYVKEARLNETDVLSDGSRFSASGTLSIVISEGAAQVDGHVINEQNKAVAGIEAVLIPDDHRNRAELFKRAVTDEQGQFSFTSVAPGNYRVFSWENIEPNSWFDESVVKKFEEKGKRVRAGESSHVTIEVRQIPEEAAP